MKILIISITTVLYVLGGIFIEKNLGVTSCPFFGWYGFVFGTINTFVLLYSNKAITEFKISYYETKLKDRNVDISHIENITLKGIREL